MSIAASDAFWESTNQRLEMIEQRLREKAVSGSPFVTEAAQHIINAGGKRFRPLLVVLASSFGGDVDDEQLVHAALGVELTHVASLYHDDVMDDADQRRGAPSANQRWNNSIAILVGDFLFAQASDAVAELGAGYVKLQAETFARLVQGQIAELRGPRGDDDPMQHYLGVLADKTGSLIATSAVYGGMIAGVETDGLEALARFGEELGLVFQLSDDIIDITSETTGKTPGTDLREGVSTLPMLLLNASQDPADAELQALIAGDLSDDQALADALARLRTHRVIDEARTEVRRRADAAIGHLSRFQEGDAREALEQACRDLVDRVQ